MILPYFIAIPLLAAFLIAVIHGEYDRWGIGLSLAALLSLLGLSLYGYLTLNGATKTYVMSAWKVPYGISIVYDSLTAFMLVIVSGIALFSLIFSARYIRYLAPDWKYYALFMLLVAGMVGVLITGDLFNLFVFMEIALLAAFALVAYGRHAEEFEAAFKYAVMGGLSSTLVLIGVAVTYSVTGTLTMSTVSETITGVDPRLVYWIGGLFVAGFGLKAAAMPFHAWLPDAHSSAPAPISAMLSGVLIKVLGIYAIIRIFFTVLGSPPIFLEIFMVLGGLSMIFAGVLSIYQWDIKRLLAYSSISQIGYILLGLGLATPLGIFGALFHLLNHAIFKSLLFYNSGAVEMATGTRDMKEMGDLTRLMPVTTNTSMIGTLSISGIPPFNGFFSKLVIIIAAVQAGEPIYAVLAIVGSILTLAAVLKMQRYGFRGEREITESKARVDWSMNLAMISLAGLCLLTSILILPGIKEAVFDSVVNVIMNNADFIQAVVGR